MNHAALFAELHDATPVINPSLLACDFGNIEAEVHRCEAAGARILHLDVMDGHFVPNLSFGIPVVEAVRRVTKLPLDVHLMISDPARYAHEFRQAGADFLTFHIEAVPEPRPVLEEIRRLGAGAGLAINPPTPLDAILRCDCLDACDLILVMSVMPGFGGQHFNPVALDKLQRLRATACSSLLLSVDGGVNMQTISSCAAAGANLFVVGTAFFSHGDYRQVMADLSDSAKSPQVHV
jgi:ribulose-phosphate 3-epimerase